MFSKNVLIGIYNQTPKINTRSTDRLVSNMAEVIADTVMDAVEEYDPLGRTGAYISDKALTAGRKVKHYFDGTAAERKLAIKEAKALLRSLPVQNKSHYKTAGAKGLRIRGGRYKKKRRSYRKKRRSYRKKRRTRRRRY